MILTRHHARIAATTRLPLRHGALCLVSMASAPRRAASSDAWSKSQDDNKLTSAEYYHFVTDTPTAQQLDALGVYRRSSAWHVKMRQAARKAADDAQKEDQLTTVDEPAIPTESKEAVDAAAKFKKLPGQRKSPRLKAIINLLRSPNPTDAEEKWERLLELERKLRKILSNLPQRKQVELRAKDDRPAKAAAIMTQALSKFEAGEMTEEEKYKTWESLRAAMPEGNFARKRPVDNSYAKRAVTGDRTRVHVADDKLCDDILEYMGSSLQRHKGCDILELYPGAGLFSTKLNDYLKPRSHILMEPEPQIYKPFLEPLLQRPGTTLVPKSGIVWDNLNSVLTPEFLPHQKEQKRSPNEPPKRNDTLLLVANFGFYPRKPYQGFKSVVSLLLFQFINSIKMGSLFQKYGLVRMLIWVAPQDVGPLLPSSVGRRGRPAIEAEFATEYIAEVCGNRPQHGPFAYHRYARHPGLDLQSAQGVLKRMRDAGLEIPQGRKTTWAMQKVLDCEVAGQDLPPLGSYKLGDAAAAEEAVSMEEFRLEKEPSARLHRAVSASRWGEVLPKRQAINELWIKAENMRAELASKGEAESAELKEVQMELARLLHEWENNAAVDPASKTNVRRYLDDVHVFDQDPPVLAWDRRPLEPFMVRPEEFFPNIPLSLIDIQPKAMDPLLLQHGFNSSRAGDYFDLILASTSVGRARPMSSIVREMAHGAEPGVNLKSIPSFTDPRLGGSFLKGEDVCPYTMNERQWMDFLEAWMKWPFRPSYQDMAAMNRDASEEDAD